ncbi:MAG: hypothetical protein ABI780_02815 [Ardenticatenales bacterium]
MIQFRVRYGQLRRELRVSHHQRAAGRALWFALLVPLGALAARLFGAQAVGWPVLAAATAAAFAAAWAWSVHHGAGIDVRAIDRRLALDDLLVTAVEVDARGPRTPLESQLLDDAAGRLAHLRAADRHEPHRIAVEIETAAALGLILVGGTLLADRWRTGPVPSPLPAIAGRSAIGADTAHAGAEAGDARSPGPAENGLASALRDQAVAHGVVEALAHGDPQAAAEALRSLADHAEELSSVGRADLADALADASKAIAPIDSALALAAAQAGQGMRDPTPPAAANGLGALADALASLVNRDLGPSATAMASGAATGRLSPAPTTAALAGGAAGGLPVAPIGHAPLGAGEGAPGRVDGGGSSGRGGQGGAGADGVPPAQREAVRRYFARDGQADPQEASP